MKKLLVSLVTLGLILTVPGSILESRVFGLGEIPRSAPGNPDLNGDGKVNSNDLVLLKRAVLGMVTGINPDLDGDGKISSSDYAILKRIILGRTFTPTPEPEPTPEPTPTPGYKAFVTAESNADENGAVSGRFVFTTKKIGDGPEGDGWRKEQITISGTAENGVDYELIPDSVYVPYGAAVYSSWPSPPSDGLAKYIYIKPIPDNLREGDETVIITLSNGESATMYIKDSIE